MSPHPRLIDGEGTSAPGAPNRGRHADWVGDQPACDRGGRSIQQHCRFSFERAGDARVAALVGEIDLSNAYAIGDAISSRMGNDARSLILDLSGLRHIDSTGIGMLFELKRRLATRRQELRFLVPAGAGIRRVLELSGLDASAKVDG